MSASAAGEWADRLLPLPQCLLGIGPAPDHEIVQALTTTGHFLHHHLAPQLRGMPLPPARAALIDRIERGAAGLRGHLPCPGDPR